MDAQVAPSSLRLEIPLANAAPMLAETTTAAARLEPDETTKSAKNEIGTFIHRMPNFRLNTSDLG